MQHLRDVFLAATLAATALSARAAAEAPRAPPPAPAATVTPAVPQQTTASFADWTLRCTRTSPTAQACEVLQTITSQDRPVAQIAFGRVGKGQPMHLTVLVPPSVTLSEAPALTGREGEAPAAELAWRRCLPAGCVAEGSVGDEALRRIRAWTEPGRISFADGAARVIALPFSPKGLAPALDALGKEDAG